MQALLRSIIRWLFPLHDPSEIPSLEVLKGQLRLRKRAIANGCKEVPPTNSSEPDEAEVSIIERVAQERRKAERRHDLQLESLSYKLARLQSGTGVADIKMQVIRAVGDFKVAADRAVTDLHLVYQKAEGERQALQTFKTVHRRIAPASYPDSQLFHWGIIGLILVLEVSMSAYFFSQGHSMGYLGGVSLAVAVSMCNIGVTILASFLLLRQLFHRNWLRKLFFGTIYFSILAMVLLLNFFFAHVRDVMSAPDFFVNNPSGVPPVQEIINKLLAGSLGFQSLESYLFLGITTLFCVVAIIDVYNMDDPYPGYGKRERQFERAYEEWVESKEEAQQLLAGSRDQQIQAIEGLQERIHEKDILQKAILLNARDTDAKYENVLHALQSHEFELIKFYRSLNEASRRTAPPSFFNEQQWGTEHKSPGGLSPLISNEELKELQSVYDDERVSAIASIQQAYEGAVSNIDQLSRVDHG